MTTVHTFEANKAVEPNTLLGDINGFTGASVDEWVNSVLIVSYEEAPYSKDKELFYWLKLDCVFEVCTENKTTDAAIVAVG